MFAPVWFALGCLTGMLIAGIGLAVAVWRDGVDDFGQGWEDGQ